MTETTKAALARIRQMPAKQAGAEGVAEYFRANRDRIAQAIPKTMDVARMELLAIEAIRKTPELQQCTVSSLFGALLNCAIIGLEPNTALGHAYLIPFNDKKKGTKDVQVMIGYRGWRELARRSGGVRDIYAYPVYEADQFAAQLGTDPRIDHVPSLSDDKGEIIAFYAVAHLMTGGVEINIMSRREVDRIKSFSATRGQSGPWRDHYAAMGCKTALKPLAMAQLMTQDLARAVEIEHGDDGEVFEMYADANVEASPENEGSDQ